MQFTHFHILNLKTSLLSSKSVFVLAPTLSQRLDLGILGSNTLALMPLILGNH